MAKKSKKRQRQYLVKVWYFVDTSMDKEELRAQTLAKWGVLLGDAIENVEICDFGDDDSFQVVPKEGKK